MTLNLIQKIDNNILGKLKKLGYSLQDVSNYIFFQNIKSHKVDKIFLMFFSTSCKICKIIRIFLFSVFLIFLLALIQKDKLHYLKFINPENGAYFILFIGLLITIYKILEYLKNKND